MNRDAILKHISNAINKQDPSAQAYLFGSQARGDNKPDSDWDVLILVNNQNVTNDIETRTHNGARNKFSEVFIKTGQIDKNIDTAVTKYLDLVKEKFADFYSGNPFVVEIRKTGIEIAA